MTVQLKSKKFNLHEKYQQMYKEEELNELFNQEVCSYVEETNYIEFTLDLILLGIDSIKYFQHSRFQLADTGLLELILLPNGGVMEYHMKVKDLEGLKKAIINLDEWEDDWNE